MSSGKMKALHYDGPFKVSVKEIDIPTIQHPDDAIIKVTTSCICGSDLHMYEGRTAAEAGLVFGHENMGVIVETGPGVTLLKKGDRIVLPFNVADGRCRNCEEGKTAFCTGVNVSPPFHTIRIGSTSPTLPRCLRSCHSNRGLGRFDNLRDSVL